MIEQEATITYEQIVRGYLKDRDEAHLLRAAQLGHRLLKEQVPPETIVEMHAGALEALTRDLPPSEWPEITRQSFVPFMETMMAYGLVFREQLDAQRRYIKELKNREEEIRRRSEELAALNAVASTVSQSLDVNATMNAALDAALETTGLEAGAIGLWDEDERRLLPVATRGAEPDLLAMFLDGPGAGGLRELALNAGQPVFVDDTTHDPRVNPDITRRGFTTSAIVPLVSKGAVSGVLTVTTRSTHQWAEHEKSAREIASHRDRSAGRRGY
jgi:putative methionine-R-sulfoxide reductase with GAF domain